MNFAAQSIIFPIFIILWNIWLNNFSPVRFLISTTIQWRIFPGTGVRQLLKVLLFFNFFAENYMKMKEFGPPREGRIPGVPLGSANAINLWFFFTLQNFLLHLHVWKFRAYREKLDWNCPLIYQVPCCPRTESASKISKFLLCRKHHHMDKNIAFSEFTSKWEYNRNWAQYTHCRWWNLRRHIQLPIRNNIKGEPLISGSQSKS